MNTVMVEEDRLGLIQRLSGVIEDTLRPLIRPGEPCALLDFPDYENVGDSAVWLGAVKCLKRLDAEIAYTSDISNHSNELLSEKIRSGFVSHCEPRKGRSNLLAEMRLLRRFAPRNDIRTYKTVSGNGTILMNGGGNFGDVWPAHQDFREKIIETFPDHKIIQLPQSIYFENKENLRRAKKILNQHADLTLLIRDHESFDLAKNEFKCQVFLCPDMAFALGPLEAETVSKKKGLALLRSDRESVLNGSPIPAEFEKADWLKDDFSLAMFFYNQAAKLCGEFPNRLRGLSQYLSDWHEAVAGIRLARGSRLLSKYDYVVTDRLHGHILCVLLGIRHACLDNATGKLKNFYETWTSGCASASWAASLQEAAEWVMGKDRENP